MAEQTGQEATPAPAAQSWTDFTSNWHTMTSCGRILDKQYFSRRREKALYTFSIF